MDDLVQTGIGAGSGGILGIIMGWFGLKSQVCDIKEDIKTMKEAVVYKDVFEQFEKRTDENFKHIANNLIDIKDLIKKNGK